jgi:uncharacterized membrane protein YqjE
MPSLAAAGSISSLLALLHTWAKRFITLATMEGKQAGLNLLLMLGLALLAAGLAFTCWLGLLAGIVLGLVQNNIFSWWVALGIAALLSFAGAGGLALMILRHSRKPLFDATRRQLGLRCNQDFEVIDGSPPLAPYEQEVEKGRLAAYAEYQVVRKSWRRRLGSPLIICGTMLTGVAVGYLVRGRHQPKERLDTGRTSAWTQVLCSVQALTPLWIALHFALRPQAATAPQPNGGEK